jgi:hypothetical protein
MMFFHGQIYPAGWHHIKKGHSLFEKLLTQVKNTMFMKNLDPFVEGYMSAWLWVDLVVRADPIFLCTLFCASMAMATSVHWSIFLLAPNELQSLCSFFS